MLLDKHGSKGKLKTVDKSDSTAYELANSQNPDLADAEKYHKGIFGALKDTDTQIYELIKEEYVRQNNTIQLIAAENLCSQSVLAALGSVVQNKTTEGFVGSRYHGGCGVVDQIETLAVNRAKQAFKAQYANVQPHSGTSANQIILTAVLDKGDKILSLALDQGGHLSHGADVSLAGKFFEVENYHVDKNTFTLDYDAVKDKAVKTKPKLIICGATAYPRAIDFKKFREIADEVGAYLLADISHISGLVIAGAHPSPVDYAHFTTTSTYKPGGPRGGAIIMGKDYCRQIKVGNKHIPLHEHIQKTTFPGIQGTPYLNHIAAKAVFFKETLTDEYRTRQFRIIENARSLAAELLNLDFDVLTKGTDNHMVLVDVSNFKPEMTGLIAQKSLERCGIIVNMNKLPYDSKPVTVTRGIRLGTPIVTKNRMAAEQMQYISELIHSVLTNVKVISPTEYTLDEQFVEQTKQRIEDLCRQFPW
ncbi:serine hydroxymethyltransferase [Planctomycetota bacterium]